jgi:hypothetical protein
MLHPVCADQVAALTNGLAPIDGLVGLHGNAAAGEVPVARNVVEDPGF